MTADGGEASDPLSVPPTAVQQGLPREHEWRQISPRYAAMQRVDLAITLGVLAAGATVVLLLAGGPAWAFVLTWAVALGLYAVAWSWVERVRRAWGYTERERDFLVRKGIAWRSLVVVPYGRMQFVDVKSGPLERWFGLATVQLHTAAAATDARIPGLPPEEAERLRDRLAALGEVHTAGL